MKDKIGRLLSVKSIRDRVFVKGPVKSILLFMVFQTFPKLASIHCMKWASYEHHRRQALGGENTLRREGWVRASREPLATVEASPTGCHLCSEVRRTAVTGQGAVKRGDHLWDGGVIDEQNCSNYQQSASGIGKIIYVSSSKKKASVV